MANGMEDMAEKNKGRAKPVKDIRYRSWRDHLGKEDSEMLLEKAVRWSARRDREYDDED